MNLALRQLRYLIALDRHRSFARAAEAIGLTQPALSRSLQSLEDEVGAKLFDRDRSRVEPTALGAMLVEMARPLLDQANSIEHGLRQIVDLEAGLLRIGAGPHAAEISAGTAVGRLLQSHPRLHVDLSVGEWPELVRRVLAGDLDLAVAEAIGLEEDERLHVETLPQHRAVLYGRTGHPLAGQGTLTLDDLHGYPVAVTSIPVRMRELVGTSARRLRVEGTTAGALASEIRVETAYLARSVVMASDALSFALPIQIASDVFAGRLTVLPLEDLPWLHTGYGIIRPARRTPSPAAVQYMRILREVESEIDAPLPTG